MKHSDVVFLAAAALLGSGIAAATLSEAVARSGWGAGTTPPGPPSAGKPRDLNLRLIRRLIEDRRLSDHEALHYRKLKPSTARDR